MCLNLEDFGGYASLSRVEWKNISLKKQKEASHAWTWFYPYMGDCFDVLT